MSNGKVYSYLRFSDAKQATGGSIDRQTEYARRWAAEHGMLLDESLTMRDEGLSAYHQKHIKTGALGVFLVAVNEGKIPAGAVLIVEGLDRLSRAEPILAQAQLAQIVNAGITVITASDGKQYNRESLKANPMDLVYSLLVMIRAHEESETKSKRVSAAIRRKCEAWVAGTFRGRIVNGRDPGWVRWNGTSFEIDPDKGEAMRAAVMLFLDGNGFVRIAKELKERKLRLTGENATNWIYNLIKRPDLIGVRVLKAAGEEFRLAGYYPRLLSDDEFARLQLEYDRRRQTPRAAGGKSNFPGIFTGINIGTCGACGLKLISQNQTRQRVDGSPAIYRRVLCSKCGAASSAAGSVGARVLEGAILEYCSDQFNLDALTTSTDQQSAKLRAEKAALIQRIADLEKKVAKIFDAALEGDDAIPRGLLVKAREMESQIAALQDRRAIVDAALLTQASVPVSGGAKAWAALRQGVLDLDFDARLKCRQMLADTFSAVRVYFAGLPDTPAGCIDLALVAKNGTERRLTVDRKTGGLVAMERDGMRAEILVDNAAVHVVKVKALPKPH